MPKPFDPEQETKFATLLAKMKVNDEAKYGPGHFDLMAERGKLLMTKRADELTDSERAFLRGIAAGQN